jgi:beta-alanine--pyruvate transaminase
MITFAKGVTSGTVPMGGVLVRKHIYDAFMKGPDYAVELFHGYTYSGHPLACAAGLATLDIYQREGLFERARALEPIWADAIHSLKGLPNVVDIRTLGLAAAVDLEPHSMGLGKRGYDGIVEAYHRQNIVMRNAGDTLVLAPPLIISEGEIAEAADKFAKVIRAIA